MIQPSDLENMGNLKGKTEGGTGGKRGHSNMDHWVTTKEIKDSTRIRRRLEDKGTIEEQLEEQEKADD